MIPCIPKDYHPQDGCHNCKHCFENYEYDDGSQWHCGINRDRPLSGSVAMGECRKQGLEIGSKKWHQAYDRWHLWAEQHRVQPWGICKKWQLREKTT